MRIASVVLIGMGFVSGTPGASPGRWPGRLRPRRQADPGEALRLVPRRGAAQGRAPARHGRRGDPRRDGRAGGRPGEGRREPALPGRHRRGRRRPDAPEAAPAAARTDRGHPRLDRRRGLGPGRRDPVDSRRSTGRSSRLDGPTRPTVRDSRLGPEPDRCASSSPRWSETGIAPSPEADRVDPDPPGLSLDLIGLPPTPAEVDAFLADDRPDAYERLVDRLLASPHFGERLGPALARPRPLRRLQRLQHRRPAARSGSIATGSSTPSTATCPSTGSPSSSSPATSCPARRSTRRSPPGFHRNTPINQEGGIDPEQFRDRVGHRPRRTRPAPPSSA